MTRRHAGAPRRDGSPQLMVAVRRVYDAAEALGPTRYAGGMRQAVLPAPGWVELRASIIAMGHAAGYDVPEESWSPAEEVGDRG